MSCRSHRISWSHWSEGTTWQERTKGKERSSRSHGTSWKIWKNRTNWSRRTERRKGRQKGTLGNRFLLLKLCCRQQGRHEMREKIRHFIARLQKILPQSWKGNLRAESFCQVQSTLLKKESWSLEIWITAMLDRTHVLPETFLESRRPLVTWLLEVRETLYFCYF